MRVGIDVIILTDWGRGRWETINQLSVEMREGFGVGGLLNCFNRRSRIILMYLS